MKTIEEEIWEYIDGEADLAQQQIIAAKIATNPVYQKMHAELMQIQQLISAQELEEPSMSFNRKVMEAVDLEIAPVSLKTKVDTRIIYSIAAFFVLSIIGIFIYAISNSNFSLPEVKLPQLNFDLALSPEKTGLLIKAFVFVDLILGLIYLDRFLRRRLDHK
jgi:anti-sigma factor RsiW